MSVSEPLANSGACCGFAAKRPKSKKEATLCYTEEKDVGSGRYLVRFRSKFLVFAESTGKRTWCGRGMRMQVLRAEKAKMVRDQGACCGKGRGTLRVQDGTGRVNDIARASSLSWKITAQSFLPFLPDKVMPGDKPQMGN